MRILTKYIAITLGLLTLLISSWIFLHVLAFLGIFLALVYPLWVVFLPRYNLCLVCRVKKEGSWCPVCQQKVTQTKHVNTVRSVLFNSVIILFFSLASIGIVMAESRILLALGIGNPPPSVSFAIPAKEQHGVGEIFPMKLAVKGITMPINAVQADISYDPTKLEVMDISTKDSFATIFIQKSINNKAGYARLTGGLSNPGFSGKEGLFGTVYFRAKTPGPAVVKFLPTTMALANDGKGTDVIKNFGSMSYLIVPATISKIPTPTTADQKVLGTTSEDETQIILYDDEATAASDTGEQLLQQPSKETVQSMLISWLNSFDVTVVGFWERILHI